jgi:hypothetical protein
LIEKIASAPNMSADASLRAHFSSIPSFSPPGGGDERSELSSLMYRIETYDEKRL